MDGVDIEDLTIEQYLRLTQESQTPRKIEDMTIAEYLEYKKKVNKNHTSNTKSYLPTYFGKSTESDYDSKDMEEEVEYMTDDEVVMSEQEESNHRYTHNIQHLEEKDDVDKWLNAEITKHMSMQGVENMKDVLISIIKSIRQEMKDDIMKRQFEASIASVSDGVSSIASNKVDKVDDNTSNIAPCRLPKELSPGSFLLPFNINNHNFYATTTLDTKDNIIPQSVYEYLGSKKIKFNIDSYQGIEKIYMVNIGQEEETFNPLEIGIDLFSYESPSCLQFKQKTRFLSTPKPQDEIAGPNNLLPDRRGLVKRWHVCKPIDVTYDDGSGEDCGMWPTCDPDLKFCFGYNEVFGKIDDTTRERRVFNNEIEHLPNEYILRIGKKGYVLDDVWEKCQQNYKKTNEAWHDEGYEEDEMW
ncbi:hypothetical protein Tco_0884432 [Tanacetum coccineum]